MTALFVALDAAPADIFCAVIGVMLIAVGLADRVVEELNRTRENS